MTRLDLGNLLCTWEKCLIDLNDAISKLIVHLEGGAHDKALRRAIETKEAIERMQVHIQKMKSYCVGEVHTNIERKI